MITTAQQLAIENEQIAELERHFAAEGDERERILLRGRIEQLQRTRIQTEGLLAKER